MPWKMAVCKFKNIVTENIFGQILEKYVPLTFNVVRLY